MKVTEPFAPCVTAVIAAEAPSKLSAEAPFVPVIKLAVMAVSSLVVKLSPTMSATGLTVMATLLVSVSTPSVVNTVRIVLPLKSAVLVAELAE